MRKASEGATCRTRSGFTLVETLLILAVLAIVTTMGIPSLLQQIHKGRLLAYGRELSLLMQRSRYESIRQHVGIIARLDLSTREVIAFADLDGVNAGDPPDGIYNPITGAVHRSTDYEVGRATLPGTLSFAAPTAFLVVEGFTTINSEQVAQFTFDGSVTDTGAFRFADSLGNFLEVQISPAATGKVTLQKYNESTSSWLEDGEEGLRWKWYNG